MTKNVMDILTIIPHGGISTKEILFVISILEPNLRAKYLEKRGKSWMYFNSYWMSSMDFVATWNIHDEDEKYFNLENRTNNALECYNLLMNNKFPTPHPSFLIFFQTIELESCEQVERCENTVRGIIKVPWIQETNIGPITFWCLTFQSVNLKCLSL